jgi:hypothetical protein
MALALSTIFLTAAAAAAQTPASEPENWTFTSVTVSSGEDALSSGITGSVWLKHEPKKAELNFTVQQSQAWVIVGRSFRLKSAKGLIAGSAGHFFGEPWVGPYFSLEVPLGKVAGQPVSASTMQWLVLNAWEPDQWKYDGTKNTEPLYLGILTSYQVNIGPIGLVASWLNFLDDPWNFLPGVSYTQKVRKDFSITGSVTRNTVAEKWMFYLGATWNP